MLKELANIFHENSIESKFSDLQIRQNSKVNKVTLFKEVFYKLIFRYNGA